MELFNQEVWDDKVKDEDKEALDDYLLELEANGRAVKTRYQYSADIKGFLCYSNKKFPKKNVLQLKRKDFRNFFLLMQRDGTSHARINRFQSSIRNFLEYLMISEDYDYDINEMHAIKGLIKEPVKSHTYLTDKQINLLLDYLVRHGKYEKALFVSLAYESCGRRNEILQVNKKDFANSNQTNTVIGKRAKRFQLIYFKRTQQLADLYLKQRGEDDIDSLWVSDYGDKRHKINYSVFYEWCNQFGRILTKLTGEEISVHPHDFRRTGLENYSMGTHHVLIESGKDALPIEVLKLIAHHSSSETTEGYLKNHDDDKLSSAFGIDIE